MFAIIAEDTSDALTLQVIVRRLSQYSTMPIRSKGYGGCGLMLRKGGKQLRLFSKMGCKRFIICYDADGPSGEPHKQRIFNDIVIPSGLSQSICLALVPVQEIEAWILADLHQAMPKLIPSWKPSEVHQPETIDSPKEYLTRLSRGHNKKPRYDHKTHNAIAARYLEIATLRIKCLSFRPLFNFVSTHRPISPPAVTHPGIGTRALFTYTNPKGGIVYTGELATSIKWGEMITYVQERAESPVELTRLCEFGWATLEPMEQELDVLLGSKPKSTIRAILTRLLAIVTARSDATHVALDDGTR